MTAHLLSIRRSVTSFLNNPGPTHIVDVKRILRYIARTTNLGLTYRKSGDNQEANKLNTSVDADHAGADDRRSVRGWCVMLMSQ